MNILSIMSYIAACSIANTVATANLGLSIIFPIGAVVWMFQKPKVPKLLIYSLLLIIALSAFSYVALRTVVSSFADVRDLGLWTFSGPALVSVELVRAFIVDILGKFGEAALILALVCICGKKAGLGVKMFIFGLLSNLLVGYFLKGGIFTLLGSFFHGL